MEAEPFKATTNVQGTGPYRWVQPSISTFRNPLLGKVEQNHMLRMAGYWLDKVATLFAQLFHSKTYEKLFQSQRFLHTFPKSVFAQLFLKC
jgi:hypothetical protein